MEYTGQAASRFVFADILYEKKEGVARVTLNRPETYNAYSSDTLREMTEAFRDAAMDDAVGVVVLTGAGDKAFCAGSDAKEFSKEFLRRPRNFWKFQGLLTEALNLFRHLGKPTIARLNGVVAGAGNDWNLAADLAIAADHVRFMQMGTRVGLVDAWTSRFRRCRGRRWPSCRRTSGGWGGRFPGRPRSAGISTLTSTPRSPRCNNGQGAAYNYRGEPALTVRGIGDAMTKLGEGPVAELAATTGTDVATYTRERPGMSAFVLEDGVVYHTYSTYARGLDGLWGVYQWLTAPPRGVTRRASGGAATTNTSRFLKTPARVATRLRTCEKRRLLDIVFLNCTLDGVTLCPEIRKPFGVLVEGLLVSPSRVDKTAIELFLIGVGALALQSSIIDVVRIASRLSTATG